MDNKKLTPHILTDMFPDIAFRRLLKNSAAQGCHVQRPGMALSHWWGANQRVQSIKVPPELCRSTEKERHLQIFFFMEENRMDSNLLSVMFYHQHQKIQTLFKKILKIQVIHLSHNDYEIDAKEKD